MAKNPLAIHDLSWAEVKERLDEGYQTVMATVGAIEQHGPQTALGTDTVLGEYIAYGVARKLGDALVVPPIAIGASWGHRHFPGTMNYRNETLIMIIEDYFYSLASHGFKHIAFIQQHGGNNAAMHIAISDHLFYQKEYDAHAYHFVPWTYSPVSGSDLFNPKAGYHANKAETSLMLAAAPDLVDMSRAKPVEIDLLPLRNKNLHFMSQAKHILQGAPRGIEAVSASGAFGDPTQATAEEGHMILNGIIEGIANELRILTASSKVKVRR